MYTPEIPAASHVGLFNFNTQNGAVAPRLIIRLHATYSIHNTGECAHNKWMVGKSRKRPAFFCISLGRLRALV
jgi:hypothetical protein